MRSNQKVKADAILKYFSGYFEPTAVEISAMRKEGFTLKSQFAS